MGQVAFRQKVLVGGLGLALLLTLHIVWQAFGFDVVSAETTSTLQGEAPLLTYDRYFQLAQVDAARIRGDNIELSRLHNKYLSHRSAAGSGSDIVLIDRLTWEIDVVHTTPNNAVQIRKVAISQDDERGYVILYDFLSGPAVLRLLVIDLSDHTVLEDNVIPIDPAPLNIGLTALPDAHLLLTYDNKAAVLDEDGQLAASLTYSPDSEDVYAPLVQAHDDYVLLIERSKNGFTPVHVLVRLRWDGTDLVEDGRADIAASDAMVINDDFVMLATAAPLAVMWLDPLTLTEVHPAMPFEPNVYYLHHLTLSAEQDRLLVGVGFDLPSGESGEYIEHIDLTDLERTQRVDLPLDLVFPDNMFSLENGRIELVNFASGAIESYLPLLAEVALPTMLNRHCSNFIYDDFSDESSGWPSRESELSKYGYDAGEFALQLKDDGVWAGVLSPYEWNAQSQLVRVSGRVINGYDVGIWGIVHGADATGFYTFEIWPRRQRYYLLRFDNVDGWTILESGTHSAIGGSSATNDTLAIRQLDGEYSYLINGQFVTFRDDMRNGFFGLSGASLDNVVDIRFDDFYFSGENCPLPAPARGTIDSRVIEREGLDTLLEQE